MHPVACGVVPAEPAGCVAAADSGLAAALDDPATFTDATAVRSLPARVEVLGKV